MKLTDEEAKEIVGKVLHNMKHTKRRDATAKTDLYKTALKAAIKWCRVALKSEGNELRQACLYILGNGIYWDGPGLKEQLRKCAFQGVVRYVPKAGVNPVAMSGRLALDRDHFCKRRGPSHYGGHC